MCIHARGACSHVCMRELAGQGLTFHGAGGADGLTQVSTHQHALPFLAPLARGLPNTPCSDLAAAQATAQSLVAAAGRQVRTCMRARAHVHARAWPCACACATTCTRV